MSLALVYIARGIDQGLLFAKNFFVAYQAYPAGYPHELIVIAKGWEGVQGRDELQRLAEVNTAKVIDLPDDGFDWGGYMRLAPELSHDWLCFLNTKSRPRVAGWLKILREAADFPTMNIGAVGATGSWGTLAPILPQPSMNEEYNTPWIYPFRFIHNAVLFLNNIRDFHSFPNPHLRSNAFIVRRNLFVRFVETHKIPLCKRDAYKLESGRNGFSRFLFSLGLKIVVAGADGKVYDPEQWNESRTFRSSMQSNLLVSDNQTLIYEMASQHIRKGLEKAAWGQILH